MNTKLKFAIIITAVIGTLGWLAAGGIEETKTYYTTVAELEEMGDKAHRERLRVAGDVQEGSIVRDGKEVHFTLVQEHLTLNVVYAGIEPLPDTFRDGAQALADGRLAEDGVFHASKIQAKCASKYEAKPGEAAAPGSQQASM
jgi:cytochrome c-type biogenesis protein CcmE